MYAYVHEGEGGLAEGWGGWEQRLVEVEEQAVASGVWEVTGSIVFLPHSVGFVYTV